jgi:hypothetical protein
MAECKSDCEFRDSQFLWSYQIGKHRNVMRPVRAVAQPLFREQCLSSLKQSLNKHGELFTCSDLEPSIEWSLCTEANKACDATVSANA